ncbi:MAG: damage-control phosphatase, subfamily [Pyrococcus sp.]|nr:ARMT1-like domain-containing protein [Pyrococcus sp.]MDK2869699.1 damage-control phosphatase, subfamily [Pyrococcus sp.]
MATEDLNFRKQGMILASKLIANEYHEKAIPAIAGSRIFVELYKFFGSEDPFKKYKELSRKKAKIVVDTLKAKIKIDIETAIKLAILGNVIDFAVGFSPEDLEKQIEEMLDKPLYIDERDELIKEVRKAKQILYLTDNVGEHLFDKILIEEIKRTSNAEIYIAGKEKPIINDVTVEDLIRDGFEALGKVVSIGTQIVGVPLNEVSQEFREVYENSDVIIAKGQGNFETLSEVKDERIFFLLKAKCPAVARELKVPRGSLICKRNG